ncbi:folate-binding protein [Sulfitobacter sp. D35]|uniref:CAF17-like 4Fe-4S cluster assembly/insertion protein YgfZ n=1 Tax=Sulfitobacter sp. D35 TaxID=3083252 RepID=UPI00296ED096|nr:folate-binding protein [Sulfitobacter sp. D35]MDW4497064.1 folate-binding protein [Sulfitobacter sp. D35]
MTDRRILRLSGRDTTDFLQGIVTNDVRKLEQGLVYAALLTPQGKYIADFFLVPDGADVLLDVAEPLGDALAQRLALYKLRADVEIVDSGLHLHRGLGDAPPDAFADPRHPALGWRAYRETPQDAQDVDWTALRVEHLVPETGIELTPDTFILEAGFDRLSGVDFRKGCYVGQEVTARMRHKTELRKGLVRVRIEGPAGPGTEIMADGKAAGRLLSRAGEHAIAYLRFDRAGSEMLAGEAKVEMEAQPV